MSSGGNDKMLDHQNDQIEKKFQWDLKTHEQQWGMKYDAGTGNFTQQFVTDESGNQKKAGTMWDAYDHQMKAWNLQVDNDEAAREFQEENRKEQWEMGLDQQAYQWHSQDELYNKNQDEVKEQLKLNEAEFNYAVAEETAILDEKLIEGAYQNLELNAEFYESIGAKGFEEIAIKHGLQKTEADMEYKGEKIASTALQQGEALSGKSAQVQLGQIGKQSDHAFKQADAVGNLKDQVVANEYKLAQIAVEKSIGAQTTDAKNMAIVRREDGIRAKAAHESQEKIIQSLKAQGKAALTQSGRSKGKAQQAIMAEIGRHSTYVANTLVRGEQAAKAEIAMSRRQQINNVHKAALAESKIEEDVISAINKAQLATSKADSDLSIGTQKDLLDIDAINSEINNLIVNSTTDIKHLENTFKHAQGEAGLKLNQNDWDIKNIESSYALDQDQLKTSLEQAVEANISNVEGLQLDKDQADLEAQVRSLIDPDAINPVTGVSFRDELSLENYEPDPLPVPGTIAPLEPTPPPDPMKGSMIDASKGMGQMAAGVAGGVAAGVGTAAALATAQQAGAWTGAAGAFATVAPWAVGAAMIYSALF